MKVFIIAGLFLTQIISAKAEDASSKDADGIVNKFLQDIRHIAISEARPGHMPSITYYTAELNPKFKPSVKLIGNYDPRTDEVAAIMIGSILSHNRLQFPFTDRVLYEDGTQVTRHYQRAVKSSQAGNKGAADLMQPDKFEMKIGVAGIISN